MYWHYTVAVPQTTYPTSYSSCYIGTHNNATACEAGSHEKYQYKTLQKCMHGYWHMAKFDIIG